MYILLHATFWVGIAVHDIFNESDYGHTHSVFTELTNSKLINFKITNFKSAPRNKMTWAWWNRRLIAYYQVLVIPGVYIRKLVIKLACSNPVHINPWHVCCCMTSNRIDWFKLPDHISWCGRCYINRNREFTFMLFTFYFTEMMSTIWDLRWRKS